MNTIRGPRLIEPGDRLPLAPCRLQGRLRRARDAAIDGWSARPCIRQASRPVGCVPRSLEQVRPTQEGAGRRPRDPGADKWTREKSKSCAKKSAARPCWRKTAGRSTSRKAPAVRSNIDATATLSSSSTKAAAGSIPCRRRKGMCFRSPNTLALAVSLTRATVLPMWLASFPAHQRGSARQGRRPLRPLQSGGDIASSRARLASLALSHRRARAAGRPREAGGRLRSVARGPPRQHVGGA